MFDSLNRTLKIQYKSLLFILLISAPSASYAAHVNLFDNSPTDIGTENPHDISGGPHNAHWSWVNPTPPSTMTNVSFYIDHANFTSDQDLRIHDSAAIWNNAGALVTLTEDLNSSSADIFVTSSITSLCGSFSGGGFLGCAEVTFTPAHNPSGYNDGHNQHLMISNSDPSATQKATFLTDPGLNWNAQSGSGSTGTGQYDFMTVAIHEFGHQLGVGHNIGHGDSGISPLQPTLNLGQEFRTLALSDVNAVKHLYGVVPLPAGVYLFISGLLGLIAFAKKRAR